MPIINVGANSTPGPATNITESLSVVAGDYIIVGGFGNGTAGAFWEVTDNAAVPGGNTYEWQYPPGNPYNGFYQRFQGHNGDMVVAYAVAQTTATIDITIDRAGPDSRTIIVANIRGEGVFDQFFIALGDNQFGGPTDRKYTASQCFTKADTFTVCFAAGGEAGATPMSFTAAHGETLVHEEILTSGTGSGGLALFSREDTGPGTDYCEINCWHTFPTRADFAPNLMGFTFSKPLTRPADFTSQFVVRGGVGFNSEDQPRVTDGYDSPPDYPYNRPLDATFPYNIEVGDLLILFGNAPRALEVAEGEPDFEDEYGNTYTSIGYDPCTTDPAQHIASTKVSWCRVTAIPAVGEIFKVRMTQPIPALNSIYQNTGMGMCMYKVAGDPTDLELAGWLSQTLATTGTIRSATITSVPQGARLIAFATCGAETTVEFTAVDSYTIQQEWDVEQVPLAITNYPRQGTAVIFEKVAPVGGDYDASIDFNTTGATPGSAIVLLAISLPSSLTLVKTVVGGAAATTDWTLSADGPTPISGAGGVGPEAVDPGSYTLSEVGNANTTNYVAGVWDCEGGTQVGDQLVLAVGESAVCTIVNTFVGPNPPPEVCIINPITTPEPSFVTYPEPRERQGS